ncbi:MAG: single-stranded-DNA-specific exonuclease RecJ [Planctomycetaceae bacterium]|jgi:single-stranded-DNA-specific exonuclease|nr:single-stranded-DNA-specific exonuclease RecJ [Planctomycetaceae bacterium]MDG2390210.1 single-stranded-DNA-specific exonuclease RecJ [Planctomycetaceae bacterium]
MPRIWHYEQHDQGRVGDLCREMRVSPLLAQVLIARGYPSKETAGKFINSKLTDLHDPELLPGISDAADLVIAALKEKRRITIYGDYDVDGMTSTSILWHCLKLAGGEVDYYIPSRLEEGYGINCDAIRELHEQDPKRLLISVDCGITSVEEAALAKELGLDLIITDHHQMVDQLPDAKVLVHPRLPGSQYPFGDLCGAGVSFKLAWAICQRLGDGKKASAHMREYLKSAVCLAAIGTIADVVPLVDENRALVRYGLAGLNELASPGLKALIKVCGIEKNKSYTASDVGFSIGPRLNAAGRLGQARLAVELLTTEDPERATQLADYLDQLNKNRQTVERRICKRAKEIVEEHPEWDSHSAIVIADDDWHPGVIGIVANRVAEHFSKPTFLIAMDSATKIGQGSGRTSGHVDLHSAMMACQELLEGCGGHKAAAGLRIRADHVDEFREQFSAFVAEKHDRAEMVEDLKIDAEVLLSDVTYRAIHELNLLGPFGQENPSPVFASGQVVLAKPAATMGEGGRHLNVQFQQNGTQLRAIAFGRGEWAEELNQQSGPILISFEPMINSFRGRESVELRLLDWKSHEPAATH